MGKFIDLHFILPIGSVFADFFQGRPVRLMRALTEEECKTKEAEQNKRAKGGG